MVEKQVEQNRYGMAIRLAELGFQTNDRVTLMAVRDRLAEIIGLENANKIIVNRALSLDVEKQRGGIPSRPRFEV